MSIDLTAIDNFLFGSNSPLNRPVIELTNEMITDKEPDGEGTFDVFMGGIYSQLEMEFTKNRITGAEYSRAYIALTESALSNAVQYLLAKDTAYWQAVTAQMGALKARVELEIAIQQLALNDAQIALLEAQTANTEQQTINLQADNTNIGKQGDILDEQRALLKEQMESQRAQTLDKRTDNANVAGLIGKQKDLYGQQVDSYKRDAEVKASKLLTDMWVTMKTVDEGLSAPTEVNNAKLNTLISNLRSRNNI